MQEIMKPGPTQFIEGFYYPKSPAVARKMQQLSANVWDA
jgi:hypothetical protein